MTDLVVRGAREHNLRGVALRLPREQLVVFTGVSGSGKSSLAFDTIHAEGQRRYLEALALHARGVQRGLDAPDVDELEGLPPTIALDQRASAPSARVTVGTYTELHHVLAVLFARAGVQHCPRCASTITPNTHDEIVARLAALPDGARLTLEAPIRGEPATLLDEIARAGFSRVRVGGEVLRLEEVRAPKGPVRVVVDRIRLAQDRRDRLHDAVRLASRAGRGVIVAVADEVEQVFVDRPYCQACDLSLPALTPRLFSWDTGEGACGSCQGLGHRDGRPCDVCGGTRLSDAARAVRWAGHALPGLLSVPLVDLVGALGAAQPEPVGEVAVAELSRRIGQLLSVGLGHLSLDRGAAGLSAGELQRLRLARQVGARLSGVLYVLDEPAAGLGRSEVVAVVRLLRELVQQGNGVIVVEHDADVIRAADRVIEFGPGAGVAGGRVVFDGDLAGLLAADTPTGRWLSGRERLPWGPPREGSGWFTLSGLTLGNLRDVSVALPIGAVAAVVGPSGSGKTTLLEAAQRHVASALGLAGAAPPAVTGVSGANAFSRVVVVDRAPGRAGRSNPATYTGLWDTLRELLASTREAQVRGLTAAHFSLAVKGGRCEACAGTGEKRVDLDLLPDVYLVCPVCDGRCFTGDVLEVRWKGLAPDELLALTIDEAHPILAGHPKLDAALRALVDVGLGYVALGQPTHSLSGGEAHRLRLARELARGARGGVERTLYVVDDPTTGLHPADIAVLLGVFRQLVADGATVWIATHHAALSVAVDWVVELGPGAGPDGGRVLRAGAPSTD